MEHNAYPGMVNACAFLQSAVWIDLLSPDAYRITASNIACVRRKLCVFFFCCRAHALHFLRRLHVKKNGKSKCHGHATYAKKEDMNYGFFPT